jgi:hypothetical protein
MVAPITTARRISDLIAPRSWSKRITLVLKGYIDGSNLHRADDVFVSVAGCCAVADKWDAWEQRWDDLLEWSSLDRWHHTEFMAHIKKRNNNTYNWPEAEWLIARRKLCDAFEIGTPLCFGATIAASEYAAACVQHSFLPADPYFFLLDRCLHRLIHGLFEYPIDEGVAIFCDQEKDKRAVVALADWHEQYLRNNNSVELEERKRKISITYGSNIDYKPLQAADVVAHEAMQFARRHPHSIISSNGDSGSWIIERLKDKMLFMIEFLAQPFLEMELNGHAFVPGFYPHFKFVRRP